MAKHSLIIDNQIIFKCLMSYLFILLFVSCSNCKENYDLKIEVDKCKQKMYLYEECVLIDSFPVSTGKAGDETPNFDQPIDGRIFKRHTSNLFPQGDYEGLGNMPYCIFISGPYAIHGTTKKNFLNLGKEASHGCVRLHPKDAEKLFKKVNAIGPKKTWVTVK